MNMAQTHIAIRTDANSQIGTGHFMRCLTLADVLKHRGAHIRFVSRELPEHLRALLTTRCMEYVSLGGELGQSPADDLAHAHFLGTSQAQDAEYSIQALSGQEWDWLIVDHYALDERWERAMRESSNKIMVIDDLADRKHDCDVLLDQNYYRDQETRYCDLLPSHCVTLLGVEYLLLRDEFANARNKLRARSGDVQRILIFFGGSDPTNETKKAVEAIKLLNNSSFKVDVVVGATNTQREEIQAMCKKLPNVIFHCQISNMAELIVNADIGIGAGGVAMWERACLGLPTITVVVAENQLRTTEDVAETGAIEYLGRSDQLSIEDYASKISSLISDPKRLRKISNASLRLLSRGRYPLERVVQQIIKSHCKESSGEDKSNF